MESMSVYFKNLLIPERNKTKKFEGLKDKMRSRMEGSNSQLLSKVRKATSIKSAIQAAPIYFIMSSLKIPLGVRKDLDLIVKRF